MAKKKIKILPRTPSLLLTEALKDLIAAERSKHYVIEMGDWHEPRDNGKCAVCFGGAVMACGLGVKRTAYTDEAFAAAGKHNEDQIYALDNVRSFYVRDFYSALCGAADLDEGSDLVVAVRALQDKYADAPQYHQDKRGFKSAIRGLIKDFRALGL